MLLLVLAGSAIQLVPDGTLFIHFTLIILMVVVLKATLLKPIGSILAERDRQTRGRVAEAKRIRQRLGATLEEYESRTRQARAEGYALLEQERAAASRARQLKLTENKEKVTGWVEDEKEKLAREAERVKSRLRDDARTTAMNISRHLLYREPR